MKKPIIDPCGHCLTKPLCDDERRLLCEEKETYNQMIFNYKIARTDKIQTVFFGMILFLMVLSLFVAD